MTTTTRTPIRLTAAFLKEILVSLEVDRGQRDALGRLQALLENQRRDRDGSVTVAPAPDLEDALLGTLDYLMDKWHNTKAYADGIAERRRLDRFIEGAMDLIASRTIRAISVS
jgi:hypothetical protein